MKIEISMWNWLYRTIWVCAGVALLSFVLYVPFIQNRPIPALGLETETALSSYEGNREFQWEE